MKSLKTQKFIAKLLFPCLVIVVLSFISPSFAPTQLVSATNHVPATNAPAATSNTNSFQANTNTVTTDSSTGKPLVEYSGVQGTIERYLCSPTGDQFALVHCVNRIYRLGVAVGGMLLVFFIALAGYLYMTGGENGKTKAKELIFSTLTGLGVLLASYLLLSFINPALTTFRPIQPPIFSAEDLPSCADLGIGVGEDCILHGSETESSTATAAGSGKAGVAIACSGGVIAMPREIPHTSGATRICKDLADRLIALKAKTSIPWIVTSTMRGARTQSGCHASSGSQAGNCADIQVLNTRQYAYDKNGSGSADPRWGQFCEDVISVGNVNFANEASNTPKCQAIRAYRTYQYTSGPHLHVNYIGR